MAAPFSDLRALAGGASKNLRGMGFMLMAAILLSTMNGITRHLSAEVHPFEIVFFRSAIGIIVLVPILARTGFVSLKTKKFDLHVWRTAINLVAMLTYFLALSIAPLAEVVALGFTAPLFAAVLAVLILREALSMKRLVSLGVGFAGALILIRPGFEEVGRGTILVLVSAVTWGVTVIIIKSLARTESSLTMTAYLSILLTPMSFVAAVFVWEWPTMTQFAWLISLGFLGTGGQLCIAQALREADAMVVLPVDFTKLIFASLIGYFFFAEIADIWIWTGGIVIFAAATYLAFGERKPPTEGRAENAPVPT